MDNGLETHQLVKVSYFNQGIASAHISVLITSNPSVQCPNLPNPLNGRVNQQGNKPGNRATYTCLTGYELDGNSTRICQNNGQWSGEAPTCEPQSMVSFITDTSLQ